MSETQYDSDGKLVTETITVPVATINYSRTVSFPGTFGAKEEASIFLQVPLNFEDGDLATQEKELKERYAFAKALVLDQLGLAHEVTPTGIVTSPPQEAAEPTAKPRTGGSRPALKPKAPTATVPTDDLWAALAGAEKNGDNWKDQSGETIWDNRTNKKNPKGPDFKFANSGKGLWVSDEPAWFKGPGQGIEL